MAAFEGNMYFVPEDPDYYLHIRYGENYMTRPPKAEREQHTYINFNLDKKG